MQAKQEPSFCRLHPDGGCRFPRKCSTCGEQIPIGMYHGMNLQDHGHPCCQALCSPKAPIPPGDRGFLVVRTSMWGKTVIDKIAIRPELSAEMRQMFRGPDGSSVVSIDFSSDCATVKLAGRIKPINATGQSGVFERTVRYGSNRTADKPAIVGPMTLTWLWWTYDGLAPAESATPVAGHAEEPPAVKDHVFEASDEDD